MSTLTLDVIPGPGARSVNISGLNTIADLVIQENLTNRDIIVNGVSIPNGTHAAHQLVANSEIFATASVKGNA